MIKKIVTLLFRFIYLSIFCLVAFLIIFYCINKIRGEVTLTINGEKQSIDSLECWYEGEDINNSTTYHVTSSGLKYKCHGSRYGMYECIFNINHDDIIISPKFYIFKTNWWKVYIVNFDMIIYQEGELWNADIMCNINGRVQQKTFYDIQNNPIEFRVE